MLLDALFGCSGEWLSGCSNEDLRDDAAGVGGEYGHQDMVLVTEWL